MSDSLTLSQLEFHSGKLDDISINGQDKRARRQRPFGLTTRTRWVRLRRQLPKQSNSTTLAVMNLALRSIEADFVSPAGAGPNTFIRDLRDDYARANPPFGNLDTALRENVFHQSKAKLQVVSKAKGNSLEDGDPHLPFALPKRMRLCSGHGVDSPHGLISFKNSDHL